MKALDSMNFEDDSDSDDTPELGAETQQAGNQSGGLNRGRIHALAFGFVWNIFVNEFTGGITAGDCILHKDSRQKLETSGANRASTTIARLQKKKRLLGGEL
jgi:hypothetical protein